jgi:hypothetical protein
MEGSRYERSRYSDGNVPNANWNDANRKVQVNWNNVDNRNPSNGPRAEVSRITSAL